MNIQDKTKALIVVTIVGLLGYDVYAWVSGGTEATISWVIFEWSYKVPAFTFFMGFVMGHFFWQMKPTEKLEESK